MRISFFEEFPDAKSLGKLRLIDWKPRLFLGAKSVKVYLDLKKRVGKAAETVYWPILEKKQGYWISPFTPYAGLKEVFDEVGRDIPVMLDLELPTTQNPLLYLSSASSFFRNKKMIRKFISMRRGKTFSCEYYPEGLLMRKVFSFLGLSHEAREVSVIKMMYHSMHRFSEGFIRKELKWGVSAQGSRFMVGLGTIAKGIHGDEKLLSPSELRRDLRLAKECGVSEAVIFRLAGLDKRYVRAIKGV